MSANLKPLTLQVRAPGKLILSGEHAVVYGHPALAMAVNRHVTATVSRELMPRILLDLADFAHRSHFSPNGLKKLKDRLKRKYHRFVRGEHSIRDVLQKPFELAQFALSVLTESTNVSLPYGVKMRVHSTIPVGCGMGSSAATILSVMTAVSHYLQMPLSPEALFQHALEAENMQHGYSSGLDLQVAMRGGCLYKHNHIIEARTFPSLSMCLVNTGTPASTTGQCVETVASYFREGSMGDDFAAVTRSFDNALQSGDISAIRTAVRENHQLLVKIGVVPELIKDFIVEIERTGGAAKICGAGAVAGDRAGVVLVMADDVQAIEAHCTKAGFSILPIQCEKRGVYVV